jgi:hypothetical protein
VDFVRRIDAGAVRECRLIAIGALEVLGDSGAGGSVDHANGRHERSGRVGRSRGPGRVAAFSVGGAKENCGESDRFVHDGISSKINEQMGVLDLWFRSEKLVDLFHL